jgi:hypothetical protein
MAIVCRSVEGNKIVNSKQIAVIHVRMVLLIFHWFEVCVKALDLNWVAKFNNPYQMEALNYLQ